MRWLKLVEGLTCGPCAILIEIIFHTVFEAPYPNFTFLLFCHLAVKCIQKFFNFSVYLKLIFRNFILGIMCFEVCQFSFKICFSSCTIKTIFCSLLSFYEFERTMRAFVSWRAWATPLKQIMIIVPAYWHIYVYLV